MIQTDKDEILIGLLSDTHIPQRTDNLPDVVLDDFKKRNVDYVFHMGDFTSFEVYEKLIETFGRDKVVAVRGNMDYDSNLKQTLPEKLEFTIYDFKVLMLHGMGGPNIIIKRLIKKLDLLNSDYDLVIFGHTHRPVNEVSNGILFFNPGTTTPIDNKFTVISSYGYLKITKDAIKPEIVSL
ncbi:MAG: metallophosphoesterase [Candidatus Lokiarchaeota archaeon]|nr:metallophosphoesterase [Candidatus Lokiarchaeota archaeon]